MNGKELKLSRLFPEAKKTVVVAIDHGQTFGPTEGLGNFQQATERLSEADGVLLAAHMIRHSGSLFVGAGSPVCIARTQLEYRALRAVALSRSQHRENLECQGCAAPWRGYSPGQPDPPDWI